VAKIQAALQTLGYMDLVTGYFGPITADALKRFQQDNGIEATGTYEALTRMAIATRLRHPHADPAPEPVAAATSEPTVPGDFADGGVADAPSPEGPADLGNEVLTPQ
jgi:peptidoglycan hydrolase-like protein with peptidoglycan-binding domain